MIKDANIQLNHEANHMVFKTDMDVWAEDDDRYNQAFLELKADKYSQR